ncbi:MAG: hypothetical protein ACE5KZ_07850 [Candidatus Scalinduaceae bacterium]
MKTLKELNEKVWYRLLKVIYIFLYISIYIFTLLISLHELARDNHPAELPETIEILLNDTDFYKLNNYDQERILYKYGGEKKVALFLEAKKRKLLPKFPKIVNLDDFLNLTYEKQLTLFNNQEMLDDFLGLPYKEKIKVIDEINKKKQFDPIKYSNKKYIYSSYYTWNFKNALMYSFFITLSYILLMELIRRIFYYIIIGKIFPKKTPD